MRTGQIIAISLTGMLTLAACGTDNTDAQVEQALKDINVVDETNLNAVMLAAADPEEAVSYFTRTAQANPDRIDLRRGLAKSLVRARRPREASEVWETVLAMPGATSEDRVEFADALIRSNRWDDAELQLDQIPPTHETFNRYRLEAMVADSKREWEKADSFYEIAVDLTTTPSGTLNNWGYSKLTRGDYPAAEQLFEEALSYDSAMFTAKNNLVLARSAQRKYDLPVVPMTQVERAELIYTSALSAIKQGDVNTGKALLAQAIATHPQYFEAAERSLEALETS